MFPLSNTHVSTNPISLYWRYLAGHKGPAEVLNWRTVHLMGDNTGQVAVTAATMYVFGMVGYALSLITRVAGVAKDLFVLIVSFVTSLFWALSFGCLFSNAVKNELNPGLRAYVLLGAIAELGSGILGCACPPLGYALDERIHTNSTWDHYSFPGWCVQDGHPSDVSRDAIEERLEGYRNEPFLGIFRTELINAKYKVPKIHHTHSSRIFLTSLAIINLLEAQDEGTDISNMNFPMVSTLTSGWASVKGAFIAVEGVDYKRTNLREVVTAILIQKFFDSKFDIPFFKDKHSAWLKVINTNFIEVLLTESKRYLQENQERVNFYFDNIFAR